MISEVLGERGWNTYAIGKWHLTPAEECDLSAWKARWPLAIALAAPGWLKAQGLALPDWWAWVRFFGLVCGGILLVIAWPVPVTRDRLPANPDDPPLPLGPRPLRASRWKDE